VPRSLEPAPVHFKQKYFVMPSDVDTKFNTKCASERRNQKDVLLKLVEAYINGKIKID
jgi:hypothetical protein